MLALLGLTTLPLRAQSDHLVPASGYFSSYSDAPEYYSRLQQTLLKGLTYSPVLRIVVLPSFEAEYALSLEQQGQTHTLTLRRFSGRNSVWHALQTKATAPVGVDRHTATISPAAARAVAEAFNAAIDQTHYPSPKERRMVTDGVTYHFVSFRVGLGLRGGTAHSPARGSTLALQRPDAPKDAELLQQTQAVTAKLAAPPTAK